MDAIPKRATYRHNIRCAYNAQGPGVPSYDARALFVHLSTFGPPDETRIHPSMATLAKLTGHDVKWVKLRIAELRKAGWITSRHKQGSNVNHYTLDWSQIRTSTTGPENGPYNWAVFVTTSSSSIDTEADHDAHGSDEEASPFND